MDDALRLLAGERVAILASVGPEGGPHLVPVVFAISGELVVTAIDWKPKSGRRLRRLQNIEANPRVSVIASAYSEDWSRLWWARVDGEATIHHGDRVWDSAVAALIDKYAQYQNRPPEGEVIAILPIKASSWNAGS